MKPDVCRAHIRRNPDRVTQSDLNSLRFRVPSLKAAQCLAYAVLRLTARSSLLSLASCAVGLLNGG